MSTSDNDNNNVIILGCQKVLENTLSIYLGGENLPTVTIIGTCMWLHAANQLPVQPSPSGPTGLPRILPSNDPYIKLPSRLPCAPQPSEPAHSLPSWSVSLNCSFTHHISFICFQALCYSALVYKDKTIQQGLGWLCNRTNVSSSALSKHENIYSICNWKQHKRSKFFPIWCIIMN